MDGPCIVIESLHKTRPLRNLEVWKESDSCIVKAMEWPSLQDLC